MTATDYRHIELDDKGVPHVAGTRTKVVEIVLDRLAYHWDADEIHRQHPHLSMPQIYSALAYYHEHQEEIDRDIIERDRYADEMLQKLSNPHVQARLRAARRTP